MLEETVPLSLDRKFVALEFKIMGTLSKVLS